MHPIDTMSWLPVDAVRPNDYNPNRQQAVNHGLLIESIRADGWTQPIVVRPPNADGVHIIIDGEHRWKAAKEMGQETLPCVVLETDLAGCMAATVRHNRARGRHGVEAMAGLVLEMEREGMPDEGIAQSIGGTVEEVRRLKASEDLFLAIASGEDRL